MLSGEFKEIIIGFNHVRVSLILLAFALAGLFQFFGLVNLLLGLGLDKSSLTLKVNWWILKPFYAKTSNILSTTMLVALD